MHLWLRSEGIMLPAVNYTRAADRAIVWKLPVYNTVHHILTNPIYAGAYAFGRTCSKVTIEAGRKRICVGSGVIAPTGRSRSSTITKVT